MRYFLDTEFHEDGRTIDLISIGVVAEDGRAFYACNLDADWPRINREPWLVTNVVPHLPEDGDLRWMSRAKIRDGLLAFVGSETPEFWAYYADYDWVALCQLFGRMIDLPAHFPKFCRDLKQLAVDKGNPTLPVQTSGEHDALADARWNREVYAFLMAKEAAPMPSAADDGWMLAAERDSIANRHSEPTGATMAAARAYAAQRVPPEPDWKDHYDRVHYLKCWPGFYKAIVDGSKRFEFRENDRDYKVGDVLALAEWEPTQAVYTGASSCWRVTWMLEGGSFGLPKKFCVMSLAPLYPDVHVGAADSSCTAPEGPPLVAHGIDVIECTVNEIVAWVRKCAANNQSLSDGSSNAYVRENAGRDARAMTWVADQIEGRAWAAPFTSATTTKGTP